VIASVLPDNTADSGGNRIAVVGGGVVGCVVALRLAAAGRRVTIFEAAPALGGLAAPWELGPLTWDRHYHVICESDETLRSLLRDLELENEILWSSVRTGFFSGGKLHDFTSVRDFLAFPPLRLHEKLRLGAAIVYASRVDPGTLRRITAANWLTKLCGRRVYSQIWEPLLRAKLGANASSVAASFIAVTIKRLFGARTNTKSKGGERFGYVPGGYARILAVLRAKLEAAKVEIRCSTPIERISARGSGVDVTVGGHSEPFDHTVITVPIPMVAGLVPELANAERATYNAIPYAGVVCASLLLDRSISPYYITNITDHWVPFSAVIEFSNVTGTAPFDGKSLVYLPKYVAPDDPLFTHDDDAIRHSFISALIRMNPGFDPAGVSAFRVSRVRNVFPFPIASAPYDPPAFATSISGVTLATAAQIDDATLNVDRSIALANAAAEHVLHGAPQGSPR
jgi:protoporphyrinogen oxidase